MDTAITVAAISLLRELLPKVIELLDDDHPRTEITEQEMKENSEEHEAALQRLKEIDSDV